VASAKRLLFRGGHIFGKPIDSAFHHVEPVSGIHKAMPLVGINNELCGNIFVPQRMPEFEGLGRRALTIAVADHDQRGRVHTLDEVDGRAFGIDSRVVID
jgi:hypothetical protein